MEIASTLKPLTLSEEAALIPHLGLLGAFLCDDCKIIPGGDAEGK